MDLKRLLKKKGWTGEETGKALILDLIHSYRQIIAGNKERKPLFESSKIDEMIRKFRTSAEDIEAYGRYTNLQHWVMQYQAVANANLQRFNASCNELISVHNAAEAAENEFRYIEQLPRILTEKEYEDLKARRIEETLDPKGDGSDANIDHLFTLIIRLILYYGVRQLERKYGKKSNPLDKILDLYSEQPAKNENIIKAYLELEDPPENGIIPDVLRRYKVMLSELGGLKLLIQKESITKWDIIGTCIIGDTRFKSGIMPYFTALFPCILGQSRNGTPITKEEHLQQITEFKEEFPELTEAMLKALDDMEFERIKGDERTVMTFSDIPLEKWQNTTVKWRQLYKGNFPGFREWVEGDYNIFQYDLRASTNGVAILRPSTIIRNRPFGKVDQAGYFSEPKMEEFYSTRYGLSAYTNDNENSGDNIANITRTRDIIDESLRILLAYDTALELIANEIGIPDFTLFKAYSQRSLERLAALNGLYEELYEHIKEINYQDKDKQNAKLQALQDVFPPFDLESYIIPDERKEAAGKMLTNLDAFGEGRNGSAPGWDFLSVLITPKGGDNE